MSESRPRDPRRTRAALTLAVLLLLIAAFQLATIRSGHSWGGDFALYVMHAANLVEGRPFAETGLIYFPDGLSPRAYPPGYPILLAPVHALFGADLEAFKVEIVLLFIAMLAALYRVFEPGLPAGVLLVVIALVGFNPYLTAFKNEVYADIPFMLCLYLAIAFVTRRCYGETGWTRDGRKAVLAALLIYAAVAMKPLGLALAVAIVLLDVLRWRSISRFSWIVSLIVGGLYVTQKLLLTGNTGQEAHFAFSAAQILRNAADVVRDLPMILAFGLERSVDSIPLSRRSLANVVGAPITLLAVYGFVSRAKRDLTLLEVFPVVFVGVLLLWPFYQHLRYVLPLLPLYLYYAYQGIEALGHERARWLTPAVTAWIAGITIASLASAEYGPLPAGVGKTETVELFEFIRAETAEDDVVVFRKPRILALQTGRRSGYDKRITDDRGFLELLDATSARWVVTGILDDAQRLEIVERTLGTEPAAFENDDFRVIRVPDRP